MNEVFIVNGCRTPIGSFKKSLSSLTAPQLGAITIKETLRRVSCKDLLVDEVLMGQVCQANCGQAPARQAAMMANLPVSVPCTTVNKDIVVAGGQESMSNVPFYLPRKEPCYGGSTLLDGLVVDGLTDAFSNHHMGIHVENLAQSFGIDRIAQDSFAKISYERSQKATLAGVFEKEIVPVTIRNSRGDEIVVSEDEECLRANFEKFSLLKPAFKNDGGTITAANASSLSDGAACVLMASRQAVERHRLKPIAKILGFVDAAVEPENFVVAPAESIKKLLTRHNIGYDDIALWEINEAFSVAVLANLQLLGGIKLDRTNVHGGAVSLGHPLGMSGARIVLHLALSLKPGEKGVAAICNGGGGASAVLLEGGC